MARMAAATPLTDLTEQEWDGQLFRGDKALARTLGWTLCYHTLRSKGSQSGFPDRVLVRDRVLFVELKRETGKPTDTQKAWIRGLLAAGAEVYLIRPSDLEDFAQVLAHRGDPWQTGRGAVVAAARLREKTRNEASP